MSYYCLACLVAVKRLCQYNSHCFSYLPQEVYGTPLEDIINQKISLTSCDIQTCSKPAQVFNVTTCRCQCPDTYCVNPKHMYDEEMCECRCESMKNCGDYTKSLRRFNFESCDCECPTDSARLSCQNQHMHFSESRCACLQVHENMRVIRATGSALILPPPILPPPPNITATGTNCTLECGPLKILKTDPCRCECVEVIPAPCMTPTPLPPRTPGKNRTKGTKGKKGKKSKSKRKTKKHKKTGKSKVYDDCPELTPGMRRFKKKHRGRGRRRTHTHTHTATQPQPFGQCPIGQQLNNVTCQCIRM